MNPVLQRPAPSSAEILPLLRMICGLDTDCADVHEAFAGGGDPGFVLLHVMGTPETFAARHIPGAVFLPHREITAERMNKWPAETLFVTYCAGAHCNAAEQAALALAKLGRPVKIMLGGIDGWARQGYTFASEPALV